MFSVAVVGRLSHLVRYLLLLAVLAVVVPLAAGDAQTLLRTLDNPNAQKAAHFGHSVAAGDVNGDGKDDIAVGAYRDYTSGTYEEQAFVFSGADGSLLSTLTAPNPQAGAQFGNSMDVGDVNGDGKGDIAVGAPYEDVGHSNQGRAYVFSGADGSLLFSLNTPNPDGYAYFGGSVSVGDVNGDGKGDVAVGAPGQDSDGSWSQGRAYVFSGADGSLLFTLDAPSPNPGAKFGISVAAGDVNGDGKGEIAVGAPFEDVGDKDWQGRAYVFSGANGSLLFTLDTPNPQAFAWFGYSLTVGDVNGDDKGDVAVGAYGYVGANPVQGRAYVFSAPLEPTPTPTPTRPPGVGGAVKLPPAAVAAESGAPAEGSGWPAATFAALVCGIAGAAVALAAAGWYARRRRYR